MEERASFYELLLRAWNLSWSGLKLYIFGGLLALVVIIQNVFTQTLPQFSSWQEALNFFQAESWWLIVGVFFLLFLIYIFGKSNLIGLLSEIEKTLGKTKALKTNSAPVSKNLLRLFLRGLILEGTVILFLVFILTLLALPIFLAWWMQREILDSLSTLAMIVFIPVGAVVFLSSRFALFYFLLSPLKLRASLENGYALFSRHVVRTLLFGLFSFALAIIFTFFLNLLMLNSSLLAEYASSDTTFTRYFPFLLSFPILSWWSILDQALWLSFFEDLARPKEEARDEEEVIIKERAPEIPPA